MKRSKHSLSHYVLSTFDMGSLVPVGHFEVLPGDSVRMSTSCLLRVSPLLSPVMHPVSVRIHHWFVPYRLLWTGFEDFITGGPTGDDSSEIPSTTQTFSEGDLGDKFGVPTGTSVEVSRLPFRAYNSIYNEFYRDQDLVSEVSLDSFNVQQVAWEKDYLTAARPWTQKGPDITIPVGTTAPVVPSGSGIPTFDGPSSDNINRPLNVNKPAFAVQFGTGATLGTGNQSLSWNDPNLEADLSAVSGIPINDLRLATALQRYQEARAQYGSRYTEYLRYLGVRSSDARLQRPEYLGGGKATISFSEVLRTGNSDDAVEEGVVGEMKGHGISAMRSRRWVRFFEEHGIVLALASVRPRSMYASGLHRFWSRRVKEDFWQKELEQIGQQEVYNREVYAAHSSPDGIFGYQDRYSEYRHMPSYVAGDFRSTLNDWHLARIFGSNPTLNADFVKCVPSKRIHADQTSDVLWGMFSHSIQARRLVGHRTIGRIF